MLARIWQDGWHARELRTTDGQRVGVVYRGVWTHSNGPDFRDAMLEISGRLVSGSVELHVRSSDWLAHGHQHNPEYDSVALHVVLEDDAVLPCTGPSGKQIPTVAIEPFLQGPVDSYAGRFLLVDLGGIGSRACLPTLASRRASLIHDTLRTEGWRRMQEKQLRFHQELTVWPPSEVLYRGLLDSLGLTTNRAGMAAVADALPLQVLERITVRFGHTGGLAALLGAGGFLPLSPAHDSLTETPPDSSITIDAVWSEIQAEYRIPAQVGTSWNLNRVRPLNHPVRRLASLAHLVSDCAEHGLLPTAIARCLAGPDGWDRWLSSAEPGIGESRRRQIMVNTLAPFVAAYADTIDDEVLSEHISALWDELPGSVDDDVARKTLRQITGGKRFPIRSALEVQGLHQIGRNGCARLRCFECPIAALALRHEPDVTVS